MTLTTTVTGRFLTVSSNLVSIHDAMVEILTYLDANGINGVKIIDVDWTQKIALVRLK